MNTSKELFFNDKWKTTVEAGSKSLGVSLTANQLGLFAAHAAHLYMWNKTINLTAIKDPEEIALKHFIDSIAVIPYINKS